MTSKYLNTTFRQARMLSDKKLLKNMITHAFLQKISKNAHKFKFAAEIRT